MNQNDIDVTRTQISDLFQYGGRTYNGLEDLHKNSITGYSDKMGMRPFAVCVEESYK